MSDYAGPIPASREDSLLVSLRQATLGDYEVLAELGRGGMAVVYLCHDLALDRKVAIKVMLPTLMMAEGAAERFKREARTAASVSHPNIIPIYAVKEYEDLLFFVMQFVGGRSLNSVIDQVAPMSIPMIETILIQVGEALAFGHRHGVIHRDVKPGNILLDEEGRAVVTDFGIAKASVDQSITRTGGVVGTPLYMSPEQCAAEPVTGSSDQYSLGLLAYEMLTGKLPFSGETQIQLMFQRCTELPRPVTDLRPDCPELLATIVMRMLERKPEDRWPNLDDAVKAIGTPSHADTTRRQMAELAKTGHSRRILAQMTTPTSPVPATKAHRAQHAASSRPGTTGEGAAHLPARGRAATRTKWAAGIAAVVLATWWVVQQTPPGSGDAVESQPPEATTPPVLAGMAQFEIVPEAADLVIGDSIFMGMSGRGGDGQAGDSTARTVRWESSDPSVATVSAAGLVAAMAEGIARVTATSRGYSATAIVRVRRAPTPAPTQVVRQRILASIIVSPAEGLLTPGATLELQASSRDDEGRAIDGGPVAWESEDGRVATVSTGGVVTARGVGTTRILAARNGVSGWATVVVQPVPVASIALRPTAVSLTVGESVSLEATVRDETGAMVGDADVSWMSDNPASATVSQGGLVTAAGTGRAVITASIQAHRAETTVSVSVPTVEEPAPSPETVRRDIEAVLQTFARAVRSRDLSAVRRAYPGMTEDEAQAYRKLLPTVEQLTMTLDGPIEAVGARRVATGRAHYRYSKGRTVEETVEYRAELDFVSGTWQLMSIISFHEP